LTVLIVLALISITLALSYAMMRSQSVNVQIQDNLGRQDDARQAALAGMAIALRKMHEADWGGVTSVVEGHVSDRDSYRVTYATGDESLTADDPEYDEYPFRVTLMSTGVSVDLDNPGIRAEHQVRAVVQLIRRQLSATPANWGQLQQADDGTPLTIYQWGNVGVPVDVPLRVEGGALLQGALRLGADYDWVDNRPFDGLIDEVAVFQRALTEEQIQDIYTAGTASGSVADRYRDNSPYAWWRLDEGAGAATADDAAGGNSGSYVGADPGEQGLPVTGTNAARFDGFNDYVDLGPMDVSGQELTLIAWFKADSFAGTTDARIISKATGTAVDDHYWLLGTCSRDGAIRLRFRLKAGGSTAQVEATSGNIQTSSWVLAAAVYDGNEMRLYKDGVLVGQTSKSGSLNANPLVTAWIGDNPPGSIRARYLRDLERMRATGGEDYRPLTGPLYLPRERSEDIYLSLIEEELSVQVNDITAASSAPLTHPGTVTSYRLYPGGKTYDVTNLPWSLSEVDIGPDPLENPLGIFVRAGTLSLYDNVSISGTVITTSGGDIRISGNNVHWSAPDMPAIEGIGPVQLPVAITADDIWIYSPKESSIRGMALAWDDFEIRKETESTSFRFQGRLIAKELELYGRSEWDMLSSDWKSYIESFMEQLLAPAEPDHTPHFPAWLGDVTARDPEPLLRLGPDPDSPAYHWQDWDQPIYVPHPNDAGLVWDLIEWTDNP
jgi:hypothetical protein